MYKYLLALFLLVSASVFADTGGIHTTEVLSTLPTDAKCASGDADVKLINDDADWDDINSGTFTIFCVEPGDYTAKNIANITADGTSGTRRYIRYYDSTETWENHPANMTDAKRAKVSELHFVTAEYWTVDRIYIDAEGSADETAPLRMQGTTNNIIINRLEVTKGKGGAGMIANGGDDLIIQNSVVHTSQNTTSADDPCISAATGSNRLKIVGNEIFNCSGSDPIIVPDGGGTNNILLADNEAYLTSAFYTDGSGNFDVNGLYMCAENAFDFKSGAAVSESHPYTNTRLRAYGNYLHGYNKLEDGTCGSNDGGDPAVTQVMHQQIEGMDYRDNVLADGTAGIVFAADTVESVSIQNNLIVDHDTAFSSGQRGTKIKYIYNTISGMRVKLMAGDSDTQDFKCNVIMNVPDDGVTAVGSSSVYDYNAIFNSDNTDIGNTNDMVFTHDSESHNELYCVPENRITNKSARCFPLASTTLESPHADMCNAPAETTDRGYDNDLQLTRVRVGFVAPKLEWTMEYEESPPIDTSGVASREFNFVAPIKDNYQFWFRATTTDKDDNSLSYSVDDRGDNIISFSHPATEWRKAKVNIGLDAGMHTLTVIEREAGIVIDKMVVTNNPTFVSP